MPYCTQTINGRIASEPRLFRLNDEKERLFLTMVTMKQILLSESQEVSSIATYHNVVIDRPTGEITPERISALKKGNIYFLKGDIKKSDYGQMDDHFVVLDKISDMQSSNRRSSINHTAILGYVHEEPIIRQSRNSEHDIIKVSVNYASALEDPMLMDVECVGERGIFNKMLKHDLKIGAVFKTDGHLNIVKSDHKPTASMIIASKEDIFENEIYTSANL